MTGKPLFRLDPQAHVLVATAADGHYGRINYAGSGRMTSQEVMKAFRKHTEKVSLSTGCFSLDSCRDEAGDGGYVYLAYPEILHWEERATEWSGKPDRIEVRITLLNLAGGEVIHSAIISGRGRWATFKWDHPQDLLPKPISEYVSSLY